MHDHSPDHRPLAGVTVLHFGHFDPEYSRNRIVAKALRRAGADVVVVTDHRSILRRTRGLLHHARGVRPDLVLVGFPGHADVLTARWLVRRSGAPVVLDAFVSLFETAEDRHDLKAWSPAGVRYRVEDRLTCALAHHLLVDTDAHGDFFVEHVGVRRPKLHRLWVGADDDVMQPRPKTSTGPFTALFYGTFIPLHGIEHVIRAAKALEDAEETVEFDIVGTGETYKDIRRLASDLGVKRVRFHGRRPYAELVELMANSDVCLGIFGTSAKADRVVPNKVFDALAVARPVVTGDTTAAREALRHGEHAWLTPPGDPHALAEAITTLKHDPALRDRLAAAGHQLFVDRFSTSALSRDLADIVTTILAEH